MEEFKNKKGIRDLALPLTFVAGAGVGAGLMYFWDPIKGKRRRAELQNQLRHMSKVSQKTMDGSVRNFVHRMKGLIMEARHRMQREELSDEVLIERVRSQMGRAVAHASSVEVAARRGIITLRGTILRHELDNFLKTVARVRGVKKVENHLNVLRFPVINSRKAVKGGL